MFSTPDYKYIGKRIGSRKENCARLIQERKKIVSSFRLSVPTLQDHLTLTSSQPSYTQVETTTPSVSSSVAVTVNEPSISFNTPSMSPSAFCTDKFDESYIANKRKNLIRYCKDLIDMNKKRRKTQCDKAKKESKCTVSFVLVRSISFAPFNSHISVIWKKIVGYMQ